MDPDKEAAFVSAVRECAPKMYRVALGFLHAPQDAQDAVSEAVEATWRKLSSIRRLDSLPAYLLRCTINVARGQLRKRKRTEPLEAYRETLAAGAPDELITHYLRDLKERDQLLLILKYQENLREADIASILHMPRGTVSSRINTLLGRMKAELTEEEASHDG